VNVDNPTFLAGDNLITVGRHALRRVPLQAEGTAGRLVVFVEEEERGTEVAFHRELEVGRLDAREEGLNRALSGQFARRVDRLDAIDRQLLALNPQNVLRRGYTLTLRKKDKSLIRTPAALRPGDRLLTQFADGTVESTVEDSRQLPLFE